MDCRIRTALEFPKSSDQADFEAFDLGLAYKASSKESSYCQ